MGGPECIYFHKTFRDLFRVIFGISIAIMAFLVPEREFWKSPERRS